MTSTGIGVEPIAGRIGAEITGVDLAGELGEASVAEIRQAVLRHKVVFFRRQTHLTDRGQEEFARRLGALTTAHPTVPGKEDAARVLPLDAHGGARANSWHTDVTFVQAPPAFSVLRGVTIPPSGGDTVWANTAAAHDELPPELKQLAEQLWATHTNAYDYAHNSRGGPSEAARRRHEQFISTLYETVHPVVRVHPETGEPALLLGHFAHQFRGVSRADFERLFGLLQSHVTRLENTVRWRWSTGDVAIWDNRATQHYAVDDYGDQAREVRRVTVAGETPVSVTGALSSSVRGDASDYLAGEVA